MAKGCIAIAGALAQKRGIGGHAWVLLQYLLGFRALGWEVLLLDCIEPDQCCDSSGEPCPVERSVQWSHALETLRPFALEGRYGLLTRGEHTALGLGYREIRGRLANCKLLLNVNGFLRDPALLDAAPCKAFLDIDPGFNQIWHELGQALLPPHDFYLTIGANVGNHGCRIPTCGVEWIHVVPPVFLQCWPETPTSTRPFTGICSWRGAFAPVQYQGSTWGLRVHEFRRFSSLPRLTGERFQLALRIDPSEASDLRDLNENGWDLISPQSVASTTSAYRRFIQSSLAEFAVAKQIYVATNSGWFSDRTACYLSSGKPALVQDTGLKNHLPTGDGLLLFSTLEEAADGIARIRRDYPFHSRRARAIAEEHLTTDKVLAKLLERLSLNG